MPATNQEEIGSLIERIEYFVPRDIEMVRKLCTEAIENGFEERSVREQSIIHRYLAFYYKDIGAFEQALNCTRRSLKIVEENNIESFRSRLYVDLGVLHRQKGEIEKSLECYSMAIEDSTFTNIPSLYINIGFIYLQFEQFSIAKSVFSRSIDLLTQQERQESMIYWKALLCYTIVESKENPNLTFIKDFDFIKLNCLQRGFFLLVSEILYQEAKLLAEMQFHEKSKLKSREGIEFSQKHNQKKWEAKLKRINKDFEWMNQPIPKLENPESWVVLNNKLFIKDAEIRRKLNEVKLINAQINPHFVFNCLSSISGLVAGNSKHLAIDGIQNLSKLLRGGLLHSRKELVTIQNELDLLKSYLELELLRNPNYFDWSLSIAPGVDILRLRIPPFILQPVVENSLKHGFKVGELNRIELSVMQDQETIVFKVTDNGEGIQQNNDSSHLSFGLKSINDKIILLGFNPNRMPPLEIKNLYDGDEISGVETIIRVKRKLG